jgi:predicted enzyme related to lactoylglutathione lyase
MQARDIDYVVYGVSSLDKAVPFYRDTLGLKPLGEPYDGKWQEFELGTSTLAISTPPYADPPKEGASGGATVAIGVRELKATLDDLRGKGVKVSWGPEETPVCFMAGISDPDGNQLILHERKDGTAG